MDESLWDGKAAGRPFPLEGRGLPLKFRLLRLVELAGSGDIRHEQIWVDMAVILQQRPQN